VWLLPAKEAVASVEDTVVIEAPAISRAGWTLGRDGIARYLSAGLPLLTVRPPRAQKVGFRQVWKDIFALPEPKFN
jgi:hypothetical protein